MQDKPVDLVTGVNGGIGFQLARDLVAHGLTVLATARAGAAAKGIGPGTYALQLDVKEVRPRTGTSSAEHPTRRLDDFNPGLQSKNQNRPD